MRGQAQATVQQQRASVDAAGDTAFLQHLLQQREECGGSCGHVRPVDGWGGTSRPCLGSSDRLRRVRRVRRDNAVRRAAAADHCHARATRSPARGDSLRGNRRCPG
ncbi:hypothetical protein G6F46_014712 [Rhizopus delemar]|nr:hypothetical protein G6F46_014712 [Rhizopus delemar]